MYSTINTNIKFKFDNIIIYNDKFDNRLYMKFHLMFICISCISIIMFRATYDIYN